MIIAYIFFFLRVIKTAIVNAIKKGIRPPDYVMFTLHGSYSDLREPPDSFWQKLLKPRGKSLQDLEGELRTVAKTPRVKGVILQLSELNLTLAQLQSLSETIKELQEKGKEVITWASSYDTFSYFLAAAGDRILLQNGGVVHTLGFANRQLYLKNALDWCGIEFDVVQISPYKSALEPFTRTNMSEEVREMMEWLTDSSYQQFLQAVIKGRRLKKEKVQLLIDKTPLFGEEAIKTGAVDDLVNAEDLPRFLGGKDKPAKVLSWDECGKIFPRPMPPLPGKYIAILRVQGNIVDGKSRRPPLRPPAPIPFLFDQMTGDLTFVQQARQVLRDKRIKAVLLYIDSGGGSATSSEAITSILNKINQKKPLVAFMGSIAGSGGYYVATPASHIVARPATVTGSIGVITAKIVNSRLLEKLLLNRETIQRGKKDLFASPEEPFTKEEKEKAWEFINHIYELFVKRVSESRNMSPEDVKDVGGGKVWTGEQALQHGLVDELGGLETALSRLRQLAKLPQNSPIMELPLPKRETAPWPDSIASIRHGLDSLEQIQNSRALLAGPLYFHRPWHGRSRPVWF